LKTNPPKEADQYSKCTLEPLVVSCCEASIIRIEQSQALSHGETGVILLYLTVIVNDKGQPIPNDIVY
jgi:hypothetical protein